MAVKWQKITTNIGWICKDWNSFSKMIRPFFAIIGTEFAAFSTNPQFVTFNLKVDFSQELRILNQCDEN